MRAVLTNFGTTGDIQPFLALAIELRQHGHEPILALSPYFADRVAQFALKFHPIGPDTYQIQVDINTARIAMSAAGDSAEQIRALFAPLAVALPQAFNDLHAICRTADVVISGTTQPTGQMVHELTGIPFVTIQLSHYDNMGKFGFQQASASLVNPFRAQLGLPPLRHAVPHDMNSSQLTIYAMSRSISPLPAYWPSHYHMPGFFFLEDEPWQPDPALVAFLDAGAPPIAVTFGSLTHSDPDALTDLILTAIECVGCRAILMQGWTGLGQRSLPSHVCSSGYVPYGWLFPRVACVVHHGGSGTSAMAFRTGVPSVFIPHLFDQPVWAKLAHAAGCTGPPLPFTELTAERLSAAITATLATPRYSQVAAVLSKQIRAEPGVKQARQLIEQLVYKVGLRHPAPAAQPPALKRGEEREENVSRRKLYHQQQRSRRRGNADGDSSQELPGGS